MVNQFGIDREELMDPDVRLLDVCCEILQNDHASALSPISRERTTPVLPWWLSKGNDSAVDHLQILCEAKRNWEENMVPGTTPYLREVVALLELLVAAEWVAASCSVSGEYRPTTLQIAYAWYWKATVYVRFVVFQVGDLDNRTALLTAAAACSNVALSEDGYYQVAFEQLKQEIVQALTVTLKARGKELIAECQAELHQRIDSSPKPAKCLAGTMITFGIMLFIGWIVSVTLAVRSGNHPKNKPQAPMSINHAPIVEITRVEPIEDLLEGNTLTIELNGRDEDGDRLSYEYQHSGRSDWLRAKGRSVSIPDLPRGEFRATFRASDGRGLYSEPITLTWSVAENPWNEWQDVGYGKAPAQTIRGSSREFGCLALSPDGWNFAVGHGSAGVICRVSDGGFVRRFSEQSNLITNVEFSPDGLLLASRDYNNTIRLWNAFSGELLQAFDGKDNRITALAIDRDGKIIANGGADGTVRLWSVADGRSTQTLTATTSPVTSLVFSPDLSTLATANQDGTIRLWNTLDGSLLHIWSAHREEVKCLAFDASGQSLASGGADGKAMLWRIPEGTQSGEMAGHTGRVNCVAFHPDGTTLATGGSDRSLRLWRISDGRMVRVLEGHASEIVSIAFSPDGLRLFSCDRAGPTKLWSTQSLSASKPVSMPSYQSVQDAQLLQIHSMGNELPDLFELSKEDSEILREAATEECVGRWRDFEDRVQKVIDRKVSAIREIIDASQEREGRRPLSDATRERIELERQLELLDIEKAIARVNGQGWQLRTNIRADAASQSKWNGILARQQELEVALASAKRAVAAHRQSTEAAKAAFLFAMQNSFPSQWLDAIPPNFQGTREDAKFMREKIATIRRLPTNSNGIRVHVNDILERIEEIGLRVGGPLDERLAAVSQEQTDFLLTNGELLRSLRNDLREIGESLKRWQTELEVVRGQRDELWKRRQQVQAP